MSDSSFPRIATWICSESQSIRKAFPISEFSGSMFKATDVIWSEEDTQSRSETQSLACFKGKTVCTLYNVHNLDIL